MNKQWLLARTPPGGLPTDEDFTLVESAHSRAWPKPDARTHHLPLA